MILSHRFAETQLSVDKVERECEQLREELARQQQQQQGVSMSRRATAVVAGSVLKPTGSGSNYHNPVDVKKIKSVRYTYNHDKTILIQVVCGC